jgi:hypothetical protein
MNDTIYYIRITKSENLAIEDNALRVFIKMKKAQDEGQLVFGDCTDDIDEFYIIWNERRINEVIENFKSTGVQMEYENLTNSILNGEYNEAFIETFSIDKNYCQLLLFMKHNLSIDNLLDKILERGEGSLTEFEKKYLCINTNEKS